jgi:hypothetical protein
MIQKVISSKGDVPWRGKVRGGTPKQKAATPKNREKA